MNTWQKEQKNARFLSFYAIKRWKSWKSMAVPQVKVSLMKKSGFSRVIHSDTRLHITVQNTKKIVQWINIAAFDVVKFVM